jgi:hypothetical protein
MSKKISIENYLRKRGINNHSVKLKLTNGSGQLANEYFNLLNIDKADVAMQEFLKQWQVLQGYKQNKPSIKVVSLMDEDV